MKKLLIMICAAVATMASRADVACSFNGADMMVAAPSTYAGLRLTLLWDTTDKGNDPAAWAHSHEIASAIPAGGERYTVNLAALGVRDRQGENQGQKNQYRRNLQNCLFHNILLLGLCPSFFALLGSFLGCP